MYYIFNFNIICFLRFVIHKINSEMLNSRIMKLTGREKTDVNDDNVIVS
jgi:hypothetical protein